MPGAQRATIAGGVADTVFRIVTTADSYLDQPSFEIRQQERQLDKLAHVDAFSASLLRANLVQLYGDLEGALHWTRNARRLTPDPQDQPKVDCVESAILSNLGYFSRAAQLLSHQPADAQLRHTHLMLTSGAWTELTSLAGTFLGSDFPRAVTAIDTAERCLRCLHDQSITQAHLQAVLDLAGGVLRKHRLLFLEDLPIIRDGGDVVLYQLLIRVQPHRAIDLTDEVIDAMIERDLALPGLTFSFLAG